LKERTCTNIVEVRSHIKLTCHCAVPRQHNDGVEDVYVGMENGCIARWNLSQSPSSSSHELLDWQAHAGAVTKLSFVSFTGNHSTATRKWIVSTSEDSTICIWSPENGQLLKEFYGHTGGVLAMCYAPQERLFWSGSRDHSVRSWCLETAEMQLRELEAMASADVEGRQLEDELIKTKIAARKRSGKSNKSMSPGRKSAGRKKKAGG